MAKKTPTEYEAMNQSGIERDCLSTWTCGGWGFSPDELIGLAFVLGPEGKRSDDPNDTVFTRTDGVEFTRGNACYWLEKWDAYLWGFTKAVEFYSTK